MSHIDEPDGFINGMIRIIWSVTIIMPWFHAINTKRRKQESRWLTTLGFLQCDNEYVQEECKTFSLGNYVNNISICVISIQLHLYMLCLNIIHDI